VKLGANKNRDKITEKSCYTDDGEKISYKKHVLPTWGPFFMEVLSSMYISEEEYLRLEREGIQRY
jgi:hypothetical protein